MIFHIFTLLFVILKVAHVVDWSWWIVFLPSILITLFALLLSLAFVTLAAKTGTVFRRKGLFL